MKMTKTFESSGGRARGAFLGALCSAVLLAAVASAPASAQPFPGPAGVFGGPAGETNLSFGGPARLVGGEALIAVRCEGPRNGLCSGTVRLFLGGESRAAPFSVLAGSRQSLDVTVGRRLAAGARSALAVARTAQGSGRLAQSRALIHFR